MSNDTARTFVLRMRAEGRSDSDIREAFRSSGWAEADIDALFADLTPPEPASRSQIGVEAPARKTGGLPVVAIVLIVAFGLVFLAMIPAAILFPVFARAREKARETSCQSNVRQIALATMMYVQDYDGHFPTAATARTVLYPYLKNDQIWLCPSNPSGGYAMSAKLSRARLASIANPAATLLFYEVDASGQPAFPHNAGAVLGYCDGHVTWLRKADAEADLGQPGVAMPRPLAPEAPQPKPSPPAAPQDLLKTFGAARDKAMSASCLSNMKELALAEMMYAQDYDSHFPRAGEYHKLIFPYVKNELIFQCPVGGTYAMNSKLSGLELKNIAEPARTILLYDVDASGRPAYRHDGEIAVAFADAHVKLCTPEEAKAFTW